MRLWDELFTEPVFVLTSDQDWSPSWASAAFLQRVRAHNIPLHIFRTNPCPVWDASVSDGAVNQGWHPNFLPASSHGTTPEEVVRYCQSHFPSVRTARSHVFAENSYAWQELANAGIVADSQMATLFQPHIEPIMHWTGIVRLPIFFEDDTFYELNPDSLKLDAVLVNAFTPGLKILNFHSTFVACNIPSKPYYEQVRSRIFGTETMADEILFKGRGTADVFEELISKVLDSGCAFKSFEQVVDDVLACVNTKKQFFPFLSVTPSVQSRKQLSE